MRLILEIVLWGLAGFAIEFLTHISAFAITIDPDCCESDLNKISVYTVDVVFYWIEGIMQIVAGVFKIVMVGANI